MNQRVDEEIAQGKRFAFGSNWRRFLSVLNETRIREAEASLRTMLEVSDLRGRSFLDVGSGSGLFSLAARRLGATVSSFDYDPQSVACTRELKRRYFPGDAAWQIEEGSVLDTAYVASRGRFDVVYSWGVLHHTGDMWRALDNVCRAVAPEGILFVAVYNDQGPASARWRIVKQLYCSAWVGRPSFARHSFPIGSPATSWAIFCVPGIRCDATWSRPGAGCQCFTTGSIGSEDCPSRSLSRRR